MTSSTDCKNCKKGRFTDEECEHSKLIWREAIVTSGNWTLKFYCLVTTPSFGGQKTMYGFRYLISDTMAVPIYEVYLSLKKYNLVLKAFTEAATKITLMKENRTILDLTLKCLENNKESAEN